jgi:hypothetical protein
VSARVLSCAVTLAVIALAPVVVLVGEPLRRYCLRRFIRAPLRSRKPRRYRAGWLPVGFARLVIANRAFIALTAPGRWAIDRVSGIGRCDSGRRGSNWRRSQGGGNWPLAGTREPRRPKPTAPAGAIALAEPRQQHWVIPIRMASPRTLSEPVRRVSSRLRRMAAVLRAQVRHRLA